MKVILSINLLDVPMGKGENYETVFFEKFEIAYLDFAGQFNATATVVDSAAQAMLGVRPPGVAGMSR